MITESAIRASFPEFSSIDDFPSPQFTFYLNFAAKRLDEQRWVDLYDEGITFFVLHYLVLAARAKDASDAGGAAALGKVKGLETSKAVDKVSVSYDVGSVSLSDAGHWNQTTYGIQFYQLVQLVGMGGIQL